MFTGIITDIGIVRNVHPGGDTIYRIETGFAVDDIAVGASIACSGACLTVLETGRDAGAARGWFAVQVSAESLSKTTIGRWQPGTPVNLERALRLGDELGGHIVSGHVDGVGHVSAITTEGDSWRVGIRVPDGMARWFAPKGSVTVDGVSLTVNEVDARGFGVNIIPHTLAVTTLGALKPGDPVNLEIDMLARYVARLSGLDAAEAERQQP